MGDNRKNLAVILAGCGHLDGSEIREAVLTLLCIDQHGAKASLFAPDQNQHHVVNHLSSQETTGGVRNVLEEAARIARGNIRPLNELRPHEYDGIILPGGYGAAKNLCSFALQGHQATVLPDLKNIILEAHSKKIPLGAICISPVILAISFKAQGFTPILTLGEAGEASQEITRLGVHHQTCAPNDICVDEINRLVSTPAYMYGQAPIGDIYQGISKLVEKITHW